MPHVMTTTGLGEQLGLADRLGLFDLAGDYCRMRWWPQALGKSLSFLVIKVAGGLGMLDLTGDSKTWM
eukprot:1158808-Pelagomonas_calceolata.AAC.2